MGRAEGEESGVSHGIRSYESCKELAFVLSEMGAMWI